MDLSLTHTQTSFRFESLILYFTLCLIVFLSPILSIIKIEGGKREMKTITPPVQIQAILFILCLKMFNHIHVKQQQVITSVKSKIL